MVALAHGKHVILAKPMATRLDEAQRMVEEAERRGVWFSIGHTQGFEPPIFRMREMISFAPKTIFGMQELNRGRERAGPSRH